METRISVPMSIEERDALRASARQDLRNPQDQARWLLRKALGLETDVIRKSANRGAVEVEAQRAAVAA